MTPENCKQLLEMGILQAYAEGKKIEVLISDWEKWEDITGRPGGLRWDSPPENYRIKPEPQFEVGDLVRTDSNHHVAKIESIGYNNIDGTVLYLNTGGWLVVNKCNIIKVREVRTPFTFEEAVKACAKHGTLLSNGLCAFMVKALTETCVCLYNPYTRETTTEEYKHYIHSLTFTSDNTPFCNISYEPTPTN